MEGLNQFPQQPRVNSASVSALEAIRSESPVQGSGVKALTVAERTEVEALLSRAGSNLEDPLLEQVPGETLKDLMDYAHLDHTTQEREVLTKRIIASLDKAKTEYYRESA
jgi:hypothetical protein